jgi:hypothetical protein
LKTTSSTFVEEKTNPFILIITPDRSGNQRKEFSLSRPEKTQFDRLRD